MFALVAVLLPSEGAPPAAQPAPSRLAVLEFGGAPDSTPAFLGKLSDEARAGALGPAKARGILVMTRENMLAIQADMGKLDACVEGECEVETGRLIGADWIISGDLIKIDDHLLLSLKLHETRGGSLLATESLEAQGELQLVRMMEKAARSLVESAFQPAVEPAVSAPAPGQGVAPAHVAAPAAPAPPPRQVSAIVRADAAPLLEAGRRSTTDRSDLVGRIGAFADAHEADGLLFLLVQLPNHVETTVAVCERLIPYIYQPDVAPRCVEALSVHRNGLNSQQRATLRLFELEGQFHEFLEVKFDDLDTLRGSLEKKLDLLRQLEKGYTGVARSKSPPAEIIAQLRVARMYDDFAENFMQSPEPPGLDEEQLIMYRTEIEDRAFPLEEKAIQAAEASREVARRSGLVSGAWAPVLDAANSILRRYGRLE